MRNITYIADKVNNNADQVSAGAQALSQGTAQQKISIDGLVSNITDITAQVQSSAVRCGNASELVERATGYAAEADTKMAQLLTATKNIDQSSAQIVSIVKTIEDIAFQTNVLALNASIEAARAGEAGRGFAVVAEEINSLSNESSMATKKIDTILKDILATVTGITGMMDSNRVIVEESNSKLEDTVQIFNAIFQSSEDVIGTIRLLKEELSNIVSIKEELLFAINEVEGISRTSVENTAQISTSTQDQVSGVQAILESMEKMQKGIKQLSEIVNAA